MNTRPPLYFVILTLILFNLIKLNVFINSKKKCFKLRKRELPVITGNFFPFNNVDYQNLKITIY